MKTFRFFTIIFVLFFSLNGWAETSTNVPTQAQPKGKLGIAAAPSILEVSMKPGTASSRTVKITNMTNHPIDVKSYVWDLWYEGEDVVFRPPGTFEETSAASWITIIPSKHKIPAGKESVFLVKIFAPIGSYGGKFAMIFFDSSPPSAVFGTKEKGTQIGLRLGVAALIEAEGTLKRGIEVTSFKISPPGSASLLKMEIGVKNTSNTYIKPKGNVVVTDQNKRFMGQFNTQVEGRETIFPGQVGTLVGEWAGLLNPGDYTAIFTVNFGAKDFKVVNQKFSIK